MDKLFDSEEGHNENADLEATVSLNRPSRQRLIAESLEGSVGAGAATSDQTMSDARYARCTRHAGHDMEGGGVPNLVVMDFRPAPDDCIGPCGGDGPGHSMHAS